jgi:transcriptional regulator with XRE-family HTH domain
VVFNNCKLDMHTRPKPRSTRPTHKLHAAGSWLLELRERRGLTQRELAQMVGVEYYTIIAQLESGRGHVPADRYLAWAAALQVEPQEFARRLMAYYDHGVVRAVTAAAAQAGDIGEAVQPRLSSPNAGCTPERD